MQRSLLVAFWIIPWFASTGLAQRDLKEIPDPDPELERRSFVVADGFEVNLFAADPMLAKPIQMNFDAEGRLWIASSEVYPHIKPGQVANDKILVLEDRDRDGRADATTVFADGLLIPTGVVPGDGGAYVANSTELLHLSDHDGDGRADRRDVVLSGFGTEDTHHLLHTLRWGPDGCLYMNQSIYIHSHVETPYGVRRLNGGGIWRFRPETMELEVFCRGFVNSWGHHFDRWGQSFATDGAFREGINYVFPGAVFVSAPGAKRVVTGLNPGSPKHCGLEILSGRHLPPDWRGNMIANDFRAHRVCRFVISEDGSGFASRQETELIKSSHVAFRPIDVKMGPDGAIYVADWYNPIIQHGEVDFRDPRRDHVHGRIWRITARGRPLVPAPHLREASVTELLETLKAPEAWNRLHAKRILRTHPRAEVVAARTRWLDALDDDDPQVEHHRLEGLWLAQTLGVRDHALLDQLLASRDHRVRAAAVRVAVDWRGEREDALAVLRRAAADSHPRVRLEAVRGLARLDSVEAASAAVQVLDRTMDRFLDFALWQTMRDLQPEWLPALAAGEFDFGGNVDHLLFALQSADSPQVGGPLLRMVRQQQLPPERAGRLLALIAALGQPEELGQLTRIVVDPPMPLTDAQRMAILEALARSAEERRAVPPPSAQQRIAPLVEAADAGVRAAALQLAGAWKVETLREPLATAAADDELPARIRAAAIAALARLGGSESVQVLDRIAGRSASYPARLAAARGLTRLAPQRAAQRLVVLLQDSAAAEASGSTPDALLGDLLASRQGPRELAAALDGKTLDSEVAKRVLRLSRASGRADEALIEAIQQAGQLNQFRWQLTPDELVSLVREVRTSGDARRGEQIYRRQQLQCSKCHAIAGAGGRVGPDLISLGASAQVDYLIESLIEPNKKVKENFHAVVVLTDEGRVLNGIAIRRSEQEIVLRDAEDREITIPGPSVESINEARSLMPDGTVDSLTRSELVDLVAFLSQLGKVGQFAVGKERYMRRWETLVWTREAHHRLNRTSFDIAATDDPHLSWQPAYSLVSGALPIGDLPVFKPHRETPPTSFVRGQIEVTTAGKIGLEWNNIEGLQLWINGKPTPPARRMEIDLSTGRHSVTIAVDRDTAPGLLRVELRDVAGSAAQAQLVTGK